MKEFLSGLEEVVARIVSLVITMLISIAYTLGNPFNQPKWQEIALFLLGFWFAYEIIGYILFTLFRFFASKKTPGDDGTIPEISEDSQENSDTPQINL